MMTFGIEAATPPLPVAIAATKRYHAVRFVKQATLLMVRKVITSARKWILTWTPNYTMHGEVTIIQQSSDLKNWLTIFTGATNTCAVYPNGQIEFWRAGNLITK